MSDIDPDVARRTSIDDGADNGNVADVTSQRRLKVDAALSAIPTTPVEYKIVALEDAGSELMNVNGSVTPVEFDFVPATNETWYLERITFIINDNGNA